MHESFILIESGFNLYRDMPNMISFFLFVLGAALGSFLNVVASRFVSGEEFVAGRSYCPHCKETLRWFELIPVISFVLLWGRCARCRAPISPRYPLVEIIMGLYLFLLADALFAHQIPALFTGIHGVLGNPWAGYFFFLLYLAVGSSALVLLLIDYETKFILVSLTRPVAILGLILTLVDSFLSPMHTIGRAFPQLLMVAGVAFFFFLIWAVTRGRGMGSGDAELALALGFFLPYPTALLMLFFSFWIGAAWGIILMLFFGYRGKSQIPFGPFIIAGFCLALFWGQSLLSYFPPLF